MIPQYQGRSNAEWSSPPAHANTHQGQAMERCCPPDQLTAFSTSEQAKKRVTFKPTATVRTYSSRNGNMTKEEKSKLYYSKHELTIFNLEVKAICTLSQELPHIRNNGTLLTLAQDSMVVIDNDNDAMDSLRGLELLMYPKRKQNKLLAQRSLVKYQTLLKSKPTISTERKHLLLAAASAKLNLWSSLVAVETARLDAIRAYEGDYLIPIDAPKAGATISPFPFYRKRRRGSGRVAGAEKAKKRKMEQR
eukprot:CAMPEP_0201896200 /NCGR_PEP_ID=MMETSP0902-20130614/44105_1 /ASSEMBLY_ACC=CAM_ASM_000551 /TAXON_ID=420261 /ORGANISM="Thalassiosira antarctica, Strain CCMP982" /LENGTH=248 /DNA_ID=CAMNT_0048428721 /DNA_START=577 /DNA_END=1323 /DNA_ORIENTATION=+